MVSEVYIGGVECVKVVVGVILSLSLCLACACMSPCAVGQSLHVPVPELECSRTSVTSRYLIFYTTTTTVPGVCKKELTPGTVFFSWEEMRPAVVLMDGGQQWQRAGAMVITATCSRALARPQSSRAGLQQ